MAVNCDTKLVVGWRVQWSSLEKWLVARGICGCAETSGHCCAHPDCWGAVTPPGWCLGVSLPFHDCPSEKCEFFLGLSQFLGVPGHVRASEIAEALAASDTMADASFLAHDLGVSEEEAVLPVLFSMPPGLIPS
jgi:hypothetical protein